MKALRGIATVIALAMIAAPLVHIYKQSAATGVEATTITRGLLWNHPVEYILYFLAFGLLNAFARSGKKEAAVSNASVVPGRSEALGAQAAVSPAQASPATKETSSPAVSVRALTTAPSSPPPQSSPTYPSTPSEYSKEWGWVENRWVKQPGPVIRAVWYTIGGALCLIAVTIFAFGLWPVAFVALVIGLAFIPWRGIVGVWIGDCPTCRKQLFVSDPTMSAVLTPIRLVCSHCTSPVEVVRNRFIAIPGTGVPVHPQ